MPKKHRQRLYTKPPSTAPIALASSSSISSTRSAKEPVQSVNQLLNHLRISQAQSSPEAHHGPAPLPVSLGQPKTHHPSVAALLGADPNPPTFRPRSRVIGSRALPRTNAGPPPPRSWLRNTAASPIAHARFPNYTPPTTEKGQNINVYRLPGMAKLGERSLMHYAFISIARNWEWIMVYEKYYLAALRPGLKSLLGAYVGAYGGGIGLGYEGLRVLYPSQKKRKRDSEGVGNDTQGAGLPGETQTSELHDTWDASIDSDSEGEPANLAGTTHLDLSYSLGKNSPDMSLSLKALERFLFSGHLLPPPPDSLLAVTTQVSTPSTTATSTGSIPNTSIPTSPRLHLPSLTHLSLAYPSNLGPSYLWSKTTPHNLPYILSYIPTLTHLSLAGWPSIPDDSGPAAVARAIQRLSRSTYCLKWLDLSAWDATVLEQAFMGTVGEVEMDGVWGGWWRGLETVVWWDGVLEEHDQWKDQVVKRWEREVGRVRRTTKGSGVRLRILVDGEEG